MKHNLLLSALAFILIFGGCQTSTPDKPSMLKALIVDGQNNHGVFPKTTQMMKSYLEQTGMFEVAIARTAFTYQGPHFDKSIGVEDITELIALYPIDGVSTTATDKPTADPNFNPNFSQYDVVISNMGWQAAHWPEATKSNFEKYMAEGGGFVVVHAANNSWGDWPEYNKMIGLGGWGGRDTESGPYVYYNTDGELIRDTSEGDCGSHGPQYEYQMTTRAPDHPIMKGLPAVWLHTPDELYDRLRGPAENMTVLATSFSDSVKNAPPWKEDFPGTGRHEPLLMTIDYGKGRVFHNGLGHMDYSMECVGFITTFLRGTEWAATGQVTLPVPGDFPTADAVSMRAWTK